MTAEVAPVNPAPLAFEIATPINGCSAVPLVKGPPAIEYAVPAVVGIAVNPVAFAGLVPVFAVSRTMVTLVKLGAVDTYALIEAATVLLGCEVNTGVS